MQLNRKSTYTFFLLAILLWKGTDLNAGNVVINELMASNTTTAADLAGEYDDWIELYNNTSAAVDLSGYYLTDKADNLTKWTFPSGTQIAANSYLIVWADESSSQTTTTELHANFKLSAQKGEKVILVSPASAIVDSISYGVQTSEKSYARTPNGTGSFSWQTATFKSKNPDGSSTTTNSTTDTTQTTVTDTTQTSTTQTAVLELTSQKWKVYPNPASDVINIQAADVDTIKSLKVYNLSGRLIDEKYIKPSLSFSVLNWPTGVYIFNIDNQLQKVIIAH